MGHLGNIGQVNGGGGGGGGGGGEECDMRYWARLFFQTIFYLFYFIFLSLLGGYLEVAPVVSTSSKTKAEKIISPKTK